MDRENTENLGTIKIADEVILSCASRAVMNTEGVYDLWGGITDTLTKNILGKNPQHKGLKISQDSDGYVIEVFIVVEYSVHIPEVAWNVQENIKNDIEKITGETVQSVNIHIQEVHFPEEEDITDDQN